MNIDELIENIIKRFKEEVYCYDSNIRNSTILSKYDSSGEKLCRKILKSEILSIRDNNMLKISKLEAKCEAYEKVISSSNFKIMLEDKNQETEKKE